MGNPRHAAAGLCVPLACVLLAVSASAADPATEPVARDAFVTLHELTATSDGLVQQALGVLPDRSLAGTLNRISALNDRKPIRDIKAKLGGRDATSDDLPDSFERGMQAALLDLKDDLAAADEAFASGAADCVVAADRAALGKGEIDCRAAKSAILQLVKQVVVNADAELAPNETSLVCRDSDGNRCDRDGIRPVDDVTRLLFETTWIRDVEELGMDRGVITGSVVDGDVDGNRAVDLQTAVDELVTHVHVPGVPEIDYGRIHGEPIIDYE